MNEENRKTALELLQNLRKNPYVINQGKKRAISDFDNERLAALKEIKEVLAKFLNGTLSLEDFKRNVDSLNKQKPYWGFRGINGQMFFNMMYKAVNEKEQLKDLLKKVLKLPKNIEEAKNKINELINFLKSTSAEIDKRKAPRLKSVLYFLSYFWQIQEPDKWPIFYNSLEQALVNLNFLEQKEELSEYYEAFYNINEELLELFMKEEADVSLWFIEHVFWLYFTQGQEVVELPKKEGKIKPTAEKLSDFIPPIISDLISLSLNESNPADFEKKTAILFQMMGFEVELKGQGKGRTADVIARANLEKPYILLIDCKARSKEDFRLNAGEERTVIEYIKKFSYDYPRDSKLETHYLIVSSGFKNDDEDVRRKIKSETGTDVSFISIRDLLFLLIKKLQNWDLDMERMREVFQREGLITNDLIQDIIIGR